MDIKEFIKKHYFLRNIALNIRNINFKYTSRGGNYL